MLCVQWQNLDEDRFDMLYKIIAGAAISDPIWTINVPWKKIEYAITPDNNFMICHFDFGRSSIESRFPFLTHTVYLDINMYL